MSSGIDELTKAIRNSVGLEDGDTVDDLQLDSEYALTCAADAINRLRDGLAESLEWNWLDEDAPEDKRKELMKLLGV